GGEHLTPRRSHRLSFQQGGSLGVPGGSIGPFEKRFGLGVSLDRLTLRIPADLAPEPEREVCQVARGHDPMSAFQVRDRVATRSDGLEEAARVAAELVVLVAR